MPGIIGFAGRFGGQRAEERLLAQMAWALEREARFRVERYQQEAWGLGRVTLGILNPEAQPLWNEARTACIVMEGELYDTKAIRQDLLGRGYPLQEESDTALLLALYEALGEAFSANLNGAFVAAIWDEAAQKLVIFNDRLGLQPLYYSQAADGIIFGSGVRALLAHPALPRCLDEVGIAQFLTFDHLLDQRTLLREVHLLPQASVLTYQDGRLRLERYWEPIHPRAYPLRTEEAWMEALLDHLRQAVARQALGGPPAGMLLSGGLDSRALLALLKERTTAEPFHTFTWGIPGCDDARFAREVAARAGVRHHFFPLEPDWLSRLGEECVRVTDGMANLVNLHARATLDAEAQVAQVLYKGFLGDAMMGFGQRYQHWADYPQACRIEAHMQAHSDLGLISFDRRARQSLLSQPLQRVVGDAVLESYRSGLAASRSTLLADQRIYFDYTQRIPRHTLNGVLVMRSRAAVRLPFADNDLVALMLTVPPGLRYERRLMRNTFIRAFPQLAQIPVPDSGLPMTECARDVLIRAQRLVRWHLKKAGLQQIDYRSRRPYKDYNTWFRTVLRDWVQDLLLSRRSLERGYFAPVAVRRLVGEHMAGTDHSIKLGILLSLELWHQQFID